MPVCFESEPPCFCDADICGGEPCFRGTRVPLSRFWKHLEVASLEDFLIGYPSVRREQALAVLRMGADRVSQWCRRENPAR